MIKNKVNEIIKDYVSSFTEDELFLDAYIKIEDLINNNISRDKDKLMKMKTDSNGLVKNATNVDLDVVTQQINNLNKIMKQIKNDYWSPKDELLAKIREIIVGMEDLIIIKHEKEMMPFFDIEKKLVLYVKRITNSIKTMLAGGYIALNDEYIRDIVSDLVYVYECNKLQLENEKGELNKLKETMKQYQEQLKIVKDNNEFRKIFNYKDMQKLAESNGYNYIRSFGDHNIYKHDESGKITVIPAHELGYGLSYAIQKQIHENIA